MVCDDFVGDRDGSADRNRNRASFFGLARNLVELRVIETLESFHHRCKVSGLDPNTSRSLLRSDRCRDREPPRASTSSSD